MSDGATRDLPRGVGIYFALLQLVFTLGWTVYAIYLPKLAASVGVAPSSVIFILMLDQAIFTVADTAMGMAADRFAPWVGRIGVFVGTLAVISCTAFVALPFVASVGQEAQGVFLALVAVWAIASSALRAPPLALIGRYAKRPSLPLLSALAMLGYGLAGAASPYLAVALRDADARIPFVLSSLILLVIALSLSRVERRIVTNAPSPAATAPKPLQGASLAFIAGTLVLALGFQIHFGLNSVALFERFVAAADLQWLMPIFWIGFSVAMFPASVIVRHHGGLVVMAAAGLVGAAALFAAEQAGSLHMMIAAQFVAGAAWGCMMASAVSAALAMGHTGAEGKVTGLVFSALALATFARMAVVAGGLQKLPDYAPLLRWAPVAFWLIAAAGLLVIAARRLSVPVKSPADG